MKTFVEGRLDLLDNPKICGMMWMQGESDGSEYSSQYLDNTRKFVSYVREDFLSFASSNGISFVDAGISTVWTNYNVINEAKKAYSLEDSNSCYFDTIEAGLHTNMEPSGHPDIAHYDSDSMVKLGNLFAENMLKVTNF